MELSKEELELIFQHRNSRKQDSKEWKPKLITDFSVEEKCKEFDGLHRLALTFFNCAKEMGREHKDAEHYAHEALMELLGPDVWKHYNNF